MRHIRHMLALLTLSAVALTATVPAFALFGKKDPPVSPDAPVAESLTLETYQGIACTGTLSAGEGSFTFAIADAPKKGEVVIAEDGVTFTYTPAPKKTGADRFTYTATDAAGRTSAPAAVSVEILKQKTAISYTDMADSTAHNAAIALAERGLYTGRQIGGSWFFEPDEALTRSEFLAIAMDAAALTVPQDVQLTGFADDGVIPTWAKSYASAAVREGLITGVSTAEGLSFCGEDAITLGEAAAVMDRLLDVADVSVATVSTGRNWAAQAVANMEAAQVIAAGSFGSGAAANSITRAEAAEMIVSAIHLMESRQETGGLFGWLKSKTASEKDGLTAP